ncbi:MAG: hypothetical protein ACI4N6_04250 [Eubacteriales bacterium]
MDEIRTTRREINEELGIVCMELSDGSIWFADNNDNYKLTKWIDVFYVKFDQDRGWVYKNGKSLPWADGDNEFPRGVIYDA